MLKQIGLSGTSAPLLVVLLASGVVQSDRLHAAETALDHYVKTADSTYAWKLAKTVPGAGCTTFVVDLTSQTWRTKKDVDRTVWRHWLVVVRPDTVRTDTAMLMIGGGDSEDRMPKRPDDRIKAIAMATGSVVAQLTNVPNQPLVFRGDGKRRYEDDLLAYSWDRYMTTGDETWIGRLPMVKSAVRAMDTIQALMTSHKGGKIAVEKFVVSGASKRGWTTWLTGAVDSRVRAIIPIVIDILNVRPSMKHHHAAYGFWAPAVHDYVDHKITEREDSPEYEALLRIEDPYFYRHRLKMPKYIVNAAGDQFFLPDSSQFYFDGLVGEKHLRYVPNTDHSLRESDATQAILAFYRAVIEEKPRPEFSWDYDNDGTLAVTVSKDQKPQSATLWTGTSPDARDFRLETVGKIYKPMSLSPQADGRYIARVRKPERGFTAFFVELTYDSGHREPMKFTTSVYVTPDVLPFKDKPLTGRP